jgi:hypothetical protein
MRITPELSDIMLGLGDSLLVAIAAILLILIIDPD